MACEYLWAESVAVKSRLYRVLALSQIGYPDKAFSLLVKVSSLKDLNWKTGKHHFYKDKD